MQRTEAEHKERVLIVDLTRRLPDISNLEFLPEDLDSYGRFAIMQTGMIWFGDIHSTHPATTQVGYYWARSEDVLYISPRGAALGWEEMIDSNVVNYIADKLGLRRRYRYYRVVM
ncbi:MAG: hypothetical protein ACLFNX_10310 [Spirochaetaceae bacterium]